MLSCWTFFERLWVTQFMFGPTPTKRDYFAWAKCGPKSRRLDSILLKPPLLLIVSSSLYFTFNQPKSSFDDSTDWQKEVACGTKLTNRHHLCRVLYYIKWAKPLAVRTWEAYGHDILPSTSFFGNLFCRTLKSLFFASSARQLNLGMLEVF